MPSELILVVEDNEKNLKLVCDMLHFYGYRTVESSTAEEGLEIARIQQPALILMDIQLPGMDGITALRHLKADSSTGHISVMAVTASATTLDREQIMTAGFDGYVIKPIHVKEFHKHVRSIIDLAYETRNRTDPSSSAGVGT